VSFVVTALGVHGATSTGARPSPSRVSSWRTTWVLILPSLASLRDALSVAILPMGEAMFMEWPVGSHLPESSSQPTLCTRLVSLVRTVME